jgi:hypothetical protein
MKSLNPKQRFYLPIVFLIAVALPFFASAAPAWSNHEQMRSEIRQFHDFLADHPKVSTELRANPNLVNSKKYLNKHEDLEKFLNRHPTVKTEIVNHPRRVFGNYYRNDRAGWYHR